MCIRDRYYILEGFSIILNSVVLLSLMMAVGFTAVKTGYISADIKNMLSKIIVKITLPLLIISSLTEVELSAARIKNSFFVIIFAALIISVLYILGFLASKALKLPPQTALIHRCMTAFGNIVFLGYPLIQALYGADGLFYAALYAFVNDIFVWTFVVWKLNCLNGGATDKKQSLKNCLNPPTAAFGISFLMLIFGIHLTGPAKDVYKRQALLVQGKHSLHVPLQAKQMSHSFQ